MRKRILILIIGLVIFGIGLTVYRVFFLKMARVPTSSMTNTIFPGDFLLMRRSFGKIERGEIVLFKYDPESPGFTERYREDPDTFHVARVIGLPR